jgi:ferritin-like metal-binding protein YciE
MATHQTTERDRIVLAKYLIEAHSKERQLETALQAQIALARRPGYEHALSDHLQVTRDQIQALQHRLYELGHDESQLPGFNAAEAILGLVSTVANKSLALAKGPLQALRGTSPADNELRSLRDCYWNEAEEIAHYRVIETVAEQVGDRETADLARKHRAEEEQMQHTLEGLLPSVVREVVATEAPDHRRDVTPTPTPAATATTSRTSSTTASRTRGSHPRSAPAAKPKARAKPSGGAKSAGTRSKAATASKSAGASGSGTNSTSNATS